MSAPDFCRTAPAHCNILETMPPPSDAMQEAINFMKKRGIRKEDMKEAWNSERVCNIDFMKKHGIGNEDVLNPWKSSLDSILL